MTDAENSDDERYANESFENESDIEVPEMSECENESTDKSDKDDNGDDDVDDENLCSVKLNTESSKRNSWPNNFASNNKTDAVPFNSSSDEEYEVIVGQTMAEINTTSMVFEDVTSAKPIQWDTRESSDEVSDEEQDDEEEMELKKIKDMEERYLQQISAKAIKTLSCKNVQEKEKSEANPQDGDDSEDTSEEAEEEEEYVFAEEIPLNYQENNLGDTSFKASCSSESQKTSKDKSTESTDQTKLTKLIEKSLVNLNITFPNNNKKYLQEFCETSVSNEIKTETVEATNTINPEKIALAIVNALKSAGLTNLTDKEKPMTSLENEENLLKNSDDRDKDGTEPIDEAHSNSNNNSSETNVTQIVPFKDVAVEEGGNSEIEEIQNNNNDDDNYIYYEAHITSKTPTSFNSDDYIFHANLIKQIHRTSSTDKLRPKPYPRKSMSFSNERMREIERHNQILLRKILAKKPTYHLKNKSSQSSLEKLPAQTNNTRLTTSAVNRKKQQRQIDLDNQVLKRKIEAIALRRPAFIT